MWKCRACGLLIMFKAVQPEIDDQGIHFICPGCGARNKLVQVSRDPSSHTVLGQPDEPPES